MAKQTKFTLDDFKFDKDLDVPDMSFDIKPKRDNRKPIIKVAHGFKEGVTSTVKSSAFVKQMVKEALPRGYGSAYDLTESSVTTLKNLYDNTAREIRPFMNDLKRVTARLLPKAEESMPKSLADKVRNWTKTADERPSSVDYDPRESEIKGMLADLVTAQAQIQQKVTSDSDVKDRLREGLEQVRHRDKVGQLDATRKGIAQLVDYQTNVTSSYHRKSLELQYRHYFVAIDALEEAKRSNAEMKATLADIVHNTALPDIVKTHASDSFKQLAKKALVGGVGQSLLGRRGEFMNTLIGNLQKTALGRAKNTIGLGRDLVGHANSILDDSDLAEAMGMSSDNLHTGGMVGGALGTDLFSSWLAKKLKPHLSKIPAVKKHGNALQYGVENLPQILNEWARGDKHEGGPLGGLSRFFKANIRSASKLQTGVQKDTLGSMNEPTFFSRHASKSITEIIPGYLARILREIQITRTGNAQTELTTYDYNKNKFNTQSVTRKHAFESLVKSDQRTWTTGDIESLIDQVDPKKTLNPEQRKALGHQLLRNNVRGHLGGADVLGKSRRYDGTAAAHSEKFSKLFRDHFNNDPDNSRKHSFAEKYNNLGAYASASRSQVQDYANVGMTDFLEHANLLNEHGDKANLEQLYAYYYGDGDYNGEGGEGAAAGSAPGGKARRPRAARPPRTRGQFMGDNRAGRSGGLGSGLNGNKTTTGLLTSLLTSNQSQESLQKQMAATLVTLGERLTAINDRIQAGLPTFSVGSVESGDIPPAATNAGGKTKKTWWWNRSVKDTFKGAAGSAWSAARGVGKVSNWLVGGSFGGVGSTLNFGRKLIQGQVGRVADRMRGFRDVYSEETGSRKILLFGAKLKAGDYLDASTGHPIKSWKDIKGAVLDEHGDEAMTLEQAKTAYVKDTAGQKAIKGLGAVVKAGTGLANALGGGLLGGLPAGWKAIGLVSKGISKLAINFMNGPQDIYVHDKEHPNRLRKALDSRTMRAGGYMSGVDDKPIKSPKDIVGEVYNHKGVTVLDDEEFKGGLYDKNGNKIQTGLGRLLGGVGKIAGAGIGAAKWLAGGLNQGIGNALGLGKGVLGAFSGLFGHQGIFFGGGKKLMSAVEQIRDILDARLPVQKKIRKGSIADQHHKRKEAEEAADRAKGQTTGGKAGGGGILGLLSGLFSRKKKDDEEAGAGHGGVVNDLEEGAGQAVGGAVLGKAGRFLSKIPGIRRLPGIRGFGTAAAEGAADVAGAAKKTGMLSKLWSGAKWGKGLGAGLGLGLAAHVANATGHTTIGSGLNAGSDVATGYSALSGIASLLGVEGGAMGALGAAGGGLLSGLAALIASPVALPALGIAAVGAGAFFGYKYLTRNKLDTLSTVRYAQYGWKADDTDATSKVFGLEDQLKDALDYTGGMANIDVKKINLKKMAELFNVDIKDKDQVGNWATWFVKRFKPVYISHMSILNRIKPGTSLRDVSSKLNNAEKKTYLDAIRIPADVYQTMVSPIPGEKSLSASADDVTKAFDAAKAEIDKNAKDGKDKPADAKSGLDQAKAAGAAAGAVVAGGAAGVTAIDKINQQAAGANNAASVAKSNAGATASSAIAAGTVLKAANSGRVSAMDAIRYKTYGLKDTDADKIHTLSQLEDMVQADVKINNKKAEWSGDASDLVAKIAPMFGFSGSRNNRAYDWMAWFHMRFLPTYLTYVTAVCSVTDKKDPKSAMGTIKPDDLFAAAKQVISTSSTSHGMPCTVWQIPVSPWVDYELNAESSSTDGNLASLKAAQKTDTLPEQTAFQKKPSAANDAGSQSAAVKAPSFMDKVSSTVSNAWDQTKQFAGNVVQGAKNAVSTATTAVGNAATAVGSVVSSAASSTASSIGSAGSAVYNAGAGVVKGAGDALNSTYNVAKSTAKSVGKTISASAAQIKNALIAAMKQAGITDPKEQAMFMAQMDHESGGFKSLSENLNYKPATLMKLFGKHFSGPADAQQVAAAGPQAIADRIYGGRNGNKGPDDGYMYRGRGVIQLTGKANYTKYGKLAGLDLVNNPDLASDPANAAKIAIAYWKDRVSSTAAKNGDVTAVTKAINGGTIGLQERAAKYQEYLQQANAGGLGGKPGPGGPDAGTGTQTASADTPAAGNAALGTAGATTGPSGGAFMKVADQTPGPAPAPKSSTPTADNASPAPSATASAAPNIGAPTTGGSVASAVNDTTAASLGGFTNRNKDLAAQGQYQNDQMAKSLGPVADVLQKQLDIQTQMRDALLQIAKAVSGGASLGGQQAAPGGSAASAADAMRKRPQPMPSPPVSMSKLI